MIGAFCAACTSSSPHAQGKLVRVVNGAVLDVCVDIRPDSPTYGQHFKAVLDGENKHMLYIPEGFAHGFHTLEDGTIFAYKCTAYYDKASERCIRWDDPALNIEWGAQDPVLSEKDLLGVPFDLNSLGRRLMYSPTQLFLIYSGLFFAALLFSAW